MSARHVTLSGHVSGWWRLRLFSALVLAAFRAVLLLRRLGLLSLADGLLAAVYDALRWPPSWARLHCVVGGRRVDMGLDGEQLFRAVVGEDAP